jgi:hypothetical protein
MASLKTCRASVVLMLALALLMGVSALAPVSAQAGNPAEIGQFTAPFEEGGAENPRCWREPPDGRIECKTPAQAVSQLIDGRIVYYNGIEASENIGFASGNELSPDAEDASSRVMDLRGPVPTWTIPGEQYGAAGNPQIKGFDLFGVLGVPGRAGDGFVGTFVSPITGEQTPSSPPDDRQFNDGDLFCAYFTTLPNGDPMALGGTDWYNEPSLSGSNDEKLDVGTVELEGIRSTRKFDTANTTWVRTSDMKYGRWYPGTVALPDGDLVVFGGVTKLVKSTQGSNVRRSETYDPETDTFTENFTGPASENSLPLEPRLHLMPDGKIHYFGTGQNWGPFGQAVDELTFALLQSWDQETKTWSINGVATLGARSGAAQTMLPLMPPYDKASVLIAGGVLCPPPGCEVAHPLSEIYSVDQNGVIGHEFTGQLHNARWFSQAVNLPDGTVMVFNGGDLDEVVIPALEAQVPQAELFDPATNEWTPMATGHRTRSYHNSAILLADGRVLSGGNAPIPTAYTHHRDIRGNNDKDSSFEIYSPPYLFRGERPVIKAQRGITWGQDFNVKVSSPSPIESVSLIRLGTAQHVVFNDQRQIYLDFVQNGNTLTVKAPPSGVIAPTGQYYLFVNRSTPDGPVPSVANIMSVSATEDTSAGFAPLLDSAASAANGSATPTEDTTFRAPGDQFCAGCRPEESSNNPLGGLFP